MRLFLIFFIAIGSVQLVSAEDKVGDFEGTKGGDRKELVPGIAFRWCPAGSFTMGSPKSETGRRDDEEQVSVSFTKGYWLGETEVTQEQWQKFMGTAPWKGQSFGVKEGANYPASFVSRDDVIAFCQKLTIQEQNAKRLPKGWNYSLPTEAQWEYACRAGTKTTFSFGENESQLNEYGWFEGNSSRAGEEYSHKVAQKKANPWGFYDMHGNVWEWCIDGFDEKLPGGRDPQRRPSGSEQVNRGGSFGDGALDCRSAVRGGVNPVFWTSNWGFRLAAVPE